jgi:hypothetical protein
VCFNAENLEIAADLQRGSHQADGDFVRMITAPNSRGHTDVRIALDADVGSASRVKGNYDGEFRLERHHCHSPLGLLQM